MKNLFSKIKTEIKFAKAGEGHKLTEDTRFDIYSVIIIHFYFNPKNMEITTRNQLKCSNFIMPLQGLLGSK